MKTAIRLLSLELLYSDQGLQSVCCSINYHHFNTIVDGKISGNLGVSVIAEGVLIFSLIMVLKVYFVHLYV